MIRPRMAAPVVAWCLAFSIVGKAQESVQANLSEQQPIGKRYVDPPATPSDVFSVADTPIGQAQAWDLESLLSLASQNNPTLRQARLQVSAELAKAQQAGLYPNPILAYAAEQIFVDVPGDVDSPGEFQGGIVKQRFITGGKLRLSREKYMRRAHISEHLAVAQQYRVCNDVRIHFYRALAQQERLRLQGELLKTAEDTAVTARELFNFGQANRYEVRKSSVMLQRMRLELQRAEHAYRMRFRELTALIGIDIPVEQLSGTLATAEYLGQYDDLVARLLHESPEMLAARAKLGADRVSIQRERVEWIPDIVVGAGSGYNFDAEETVAVADVSVEIPLFDRNQGTIAQARADYTRQQLEIERLELQLRRRLAALYEQYAMAFEHAAEYRETIVPEMRAAYLELLNSYEASRVAWPEVLQAQKDYADVRLVQIDYEEELRRSEVLLQGYLLEGGLSAAVGPTPPGHIDSVPKPR